MASLLPAPAPEVDSEGRQLLAVLAANLARD